MKPAEEVKNHKMYPQLIGILRVDSEMFENKISAILENEGMLRDVFHLCWNIYDQLIIGQKVSGLLASRLNDLLGKI